MQKKYIYCGVLTYQHIVLICPIWKYKPFLLGESSAALWRVHFYLKATYSTEVTLRYSCLCIYYWFDIFFMVWKYFYDLQWYYSKYNSNKHFTVVIMKVMKEKMK